jgi:hypothetical protein
MTATGTRVSDETVAYRGRRRDVADARATTRLALRGDAYTEVREAAVLAVSELVTNAVVHAPGPLTLRVRVDSSPVPPRPREAAPQDLGGRGLAMVLRVVSAWGHEGSPDGKVVWCELAV